MLLKCHITSVDIVFVHSVPRQYSGELLCLVPLHDTLPPVLLAEPVQALCELGLAVLVPLVNAVHDVDAVLLGVGEALAHVARKACEVGGHGGDAAERALCGCVPPGLVVGAEDAEVAPADKVGVVEGKDWTCGGKEFWVIDNLNPIVGHVEELDTTEMIQNLYVNN